MNKIIYVIIFIPYLFCAKRNEIFSDYGLLSPVKIKTNEKIHIVNQSKNKYTFKKTCAKCYDDYIEVKSNKGWEPFVFLNSNGRQISKRPFKVLYKGLFTLYPDSVMELNSLDSRGKFNKPNTIRIRLFFEFEGKMVDAVSKPIIVD